MPVEEIETDKGPEPLCQAVSPDVEPCYSPATVQCVKCHRWFCYTHAEDEEWHQCILPPSEEPSGEKDEEENEGEDGEA